MCDSAETSIRMGVHMGIVADIAVGMVVSMSLGMVQICYKWQLV